MVPIRLLLNVWHCKSGSEFPQFVKVPRMTLRQTDTHTHADSPGKQTKPEDKIDKIGELKANIL